MPVVSVVTPFYNSAEYLDECINSVLSQTFADFEYLLLNNSSTDNSLSIAAYYEGRDQRVRVVDCSKFVPQLVNYNRAVKEISRNSTFCKIVQADDWIFPRCLEEMVRLGQSDERVGLISSYRIDSDRVSCAGLPPQREIFEGRDVARKQLIDSYFFCGSPTTVMYRSEIMRNEDPFPIGALHGDTELCYKILAQWRFGFVHEVLSYTRRQSGSIMVKSREFDSDVLDKLIIMRKFGSIYLSRSEFASSWKRIEARYFRVLGKAVLHCRYSDYWAYHRVGWNWLNYRPNWSIIALYTLNAALDVALNPKLTLEKIWRRLSAGIRRLRKLD